MADINSLPKEILSLVLSFLGADTKIVARLACTQWFKLIRHAHFELNLIRDDQWPLVASRLSKYDMPISIAFSSQPERSLENLMGPLTTLTNLESLTLGAIARQHNVEDWLRLTCLTNLKYFVPSRSPKYELFSSMTWLRNFAASNVLASNTMHFIPNWTNLEELIFRHYDEVGDAFELIKYNSRLTHLSLYYDGCQRANEENTKALSNLKYFSFTADTTVEISLRYMTALDSLEITPPFHSLASSRLTFLCAPSGAMRSLAVHSTNLCNLKALDVSVSPEDANFFKSLVTLLTALETLSLHLSQAGEDFDVIYNSLATTRLTELQLADWKLTEPIRITSLNSLSLFRLSEADYGSLTLLVNLTHLSVTPANGGLTLLPALTSIKYLELSSARIETGFHQMTNLEHLNIAVCEAHDLNGLKNATRLTKLELGSTRNHIADFGFLKNCTLLEEICISKLIGQNFWQNVCGLTRLRILQFPRMEQEEHVQILTALQNLRHLDTAAQNLQGKYLTLLTSLQTLNFLSDIAAKYISIERLYSSLTRLASHQL